MLAFKKIPSTLPLACAAIGLSIFATGCGETPWWELESPCPEGANLYGSAPPSLTVTAPTAETPLRPTHTIWCGRTDSSLQREGPYQSWYANGQVNTVGSMVPIEGGGDRKDVEMTVYDLLGRVIMHKEKGTTQTQANWWHADGTRAISALAEQPTFFGQVLNSKWTEWDESGRLVGQVEYKSGVADTLEGSSKLLLYVSQARVHADMAGFYLGKGREHLPVSSSIVAPGPEFPSLDITHSELKYVGLSIRLKDGVIDSNDMRGALVPELYDEVLKDRKRSAEHAQELMSLSKASEQDEGVQPPMDENKDTMLLLADAGLPFSTVGAAMFTAEQAGVRVFNILTTVPGLQWPPRTGLPQMQGSVVWTVVPTTLSVVESGKPRPITATVVIKPSKVVVRLIQASDGAGGLLTASVEGVDDVDIACKKQDCSGAKPFDQEALSRAIGALRPHTSTTESTLMVVPSADTPVQTIVHILDAARPHLPKSAIAHTPPAWSLDSTPGPK